MNKKIQKAIKEATDSYKSEFDEAALDREWTETAYADLSSDDQKQITWSLFHSMIEAGLGENFHVTRVTEGGVYGHSDSSCDEGGCAAGSEVYFAEVDADEVEEGHTYAITAQGKVVAEVEV